MTADPGRTIREAQALGTKAYAAPERHAVRAPELDTLYSQVWQRPDGTIFLVPKGV